MSASALWIKPLLEVLESKTSVKVLGAVFVITLIALCLPRSWKDRVYMTPWVSWLWPWLVVVCALCGLILLFTVIDVLASPRLLKRKTAKRINQYLEYLPIDEIQVLQQYSDGRKSNDFYPYQSGVQNLVKEGILYCSYDPRGSGGMGIYTITSEASSFLRRGEFQKILDRITKRDQEARQASIDDRSSQKP
jgi:amino acid transporter